LKVWTKMTARDFAGPAFLSIGFRPFFLGGASWAAAAMVIWIGMLAGWWLVVGDYGAVAWHAHEFLFGYIGAVMTGFLLTVVPNWTGRLPVRGRPLLALFLLWLAGRAALLFSDTIGVIPAVVVDSLFLLTLAAVALREVIAGRNWRNLKVVGIIGLLAATNILFHAEVIATGVADYAARAATALVLILIMLIGGRIIPSFTRNWLVKQGVARLPVPFGRFDAISIVVAAAALLSWVAAPDAVATGVALLVAGGVQTVRLARWAGAPTWREPLLLILHVGYAFVPIGFFAVGTAALRPDVIPPSGALHVWTAGGMVLMTLAVMTRATLGHTGRDLVAGGATCAIYLAAGVAMLTRVAAPAFPDASTPLLHLAAVAWILGFGLFAVWYGRMLVRPRVDA
jgi:uncharacterized protein involved in response to NO